MAPRGFAKSRRLLSTGMLVMLVTAAAHTAVGQTAPDTTRPRHTKADVAFMQGMIAHHGQAIVMSALVPSRTERVPLRMLAERITVSQRDEIRLMRTWLLDRHEEAPVAGAHQMPHDGGALVVLMPGMLIAERLAELEAARGPEFERLFLESMIRHHEGALTMVATLFGTPGGGQEVDAFRFASDVDADQRAEIRRMRALLEATPSGTRRP